MKKFVIHILLFLVVSSGIYCLLIFVWGQTTPIYFNKNLNYKIGSYGFMHSRIHDANIVKDVDILFLGSSHAYRGFDVRFYEQLGYKTFNFGSSAQTPIQTNLLLKRYLNKFNPKHIIYDIYPESFNNDGIESALDVIANSRNDWYSIKMAFNINQIKVYNTLIYGVVNDFLDVNSNYREAKRKGTDTYIENGFVQKDLSFYNSQYTHDIKWDFKNSQRDAFEELVQTIIAKNIKLSLIQVPVTNSRYEGYRDKLKFDNYMRNYCDYYNFNELITLNDTIHFYDTQHLNMKGSKIFNNFLKNLLLKK